MSIPHRKLLLLLLLSTCHNLLAVEPTGWDADNAFEVDPCVWAIGRIRDYYEEGRADYAGLVSSIGPTASDVIEAVERDGQMFRFAWSIDLQAQRALGLRPISEYESEIPQQDLVLIRDVPSWDDELTNQQRSEVIPILTPKYRKLFGADAIKPDTRAFEHLQSVMINRRISELRYDQEASDPLVRALFQGTPVPRVYIVGALKKEYQLAVPSRFLRDRNPDEPVLSLVGEEYPLYPGPLSKLSSLARVDIWTEDNPLAHDGAPQFNADSFRYTGMFAGRHQWFCEDAEKILEVANSALSFSGRDRVRFELPLTHQFRTEAKVGDEDVDGDVDRGVNDLAFYLGGFLAYRLNAESEVGVTYGELRTAIRESLLEVAIAFTKEPRVLVTQENRPSDIMDEPTVIAPRGATDPNYTFVFRRRDGKSIEIVFTGPENVVDYAEDLMEEFEKKS